jgi:hypothetical protein
VDELLPLRETRLLEVHAQSQSAVAFLLSAAQVPVHRMPRTLEFLDAALALQMALQMRIKHQLACARPHEMAPNLLPMIDVPSHGSLPSGHAGESALVAALLMHLMASGPASPRVMLHRMALRIAENRVVAGVHFPVDSLAGRLLGEAVADYLLAGVGERPNVRVRRFGAGAWGAAADGLPRAEGEAHLSPECGLDGEVAAPDLPDHRTLWDLVKKEWA